MTFDKGDLVRVYARFKHDGSPVDPSTVSISVKPPSGGATTYTYAASQVIKESTGIYYYPVNVTQTGTYYVRVETTGTYQGAVEDSFRVRSTQF